MNYIFIEIINKEIEDFIFIKSIKFLLIIKKLFIFFWYFLYLIDKAYVEIKGKFSILFLLLPYKKYDLFLYNYLYLVNYYFF
jgi:hypothetical protein